MEGDEISHIRRAVIHPHQMDNGYVAYVATAPYFIEHPEVQIVDGKEICVVSCKRSPEPVFLSWKGIEKENTGDFFVRSGPGTVKLSPDSAGKFIRTRFPGSGEE